MTLKLINKSSTGETSEKVIAKSVVLFGRGSECDVILTGRDVSLRHAQISLERNQSGIPQFSIEDLNSLSGVTVNGKLIKRAILGSRDVFTIASKEYHVEVEFTADLNEPSILLYTNSDLSVAPTSKDEERNLALLAAQFTARGSLPSVRLVSWVAIGLIALGAIIYPLLSGQKIAWSTGEISSFHKNFEADCSSCHAGGFKAVADSACVKCHELSPHGGKVDQEIHTQANRDCVGCHQEHNGIAAVTVSNPKLCTDCHTNVQSAPTFRSDTLGGQKQKLLDVNDFKSHPEFSTAQGKTDLGSIKLNHAAHLAPNIRGPNGSVTLECSDCHALGADNRSIQPIVMAKNCLSCHPLNYDEKNPTVSAPHGSADEVYRSIYRHFAEQVLSATSTSTLNSKSDRMRPGEKAKANDAERVRLAQAEVTRVSRAAEHDLFTRTGCQLCHTVTPNDSSAAHESSAFKIESPIIPSVWMPKASFNHAKHDYMSCNSCHAGIEKSQNSSDLIMPKIAQCQECHSQTESSGKIRSDCIMCHSYHDALPLPADRKLANFTASQKTQTLTKLLNDIGQFNR